MKEYALALNLLLLSLLMVVSCQSDDGPQVYEQGTNEYTNQWMYEQMKRYYYWNDTMPGQGDLSQDPKDYFARLLESHDRFSFAMHPTMSETVPQNLRSTFGFDISFAMYEGQVYGVILYVLSDSPAENMGLRRGQLITTINGIGLSQENYDALYHDLANSGQVQLHVVEYDGETGFSVPEQFTIYRGLTFLQPLHRRIITQGNDKIGYVEIPHFDVGLAQSLLQAFLDFQEQAVTKVVVDLRYNGGGDISSATALSIILAPDIDPGDPFITFKGNDNGGNITQSFEEALEMNESQVSFQELRSVHPPIQKLYVLCGSHTASASEIIINNLKPFMEVVTIGEKTVGKDVAGFPIKDDRIPGQQGWILYPSIYKLFNANNQGDYAAGIAPAIELNELQQAEILPLGDPNEVLLKQALNTVSTNGHMANGRGMDPLPKVCSNPTNDPLLKRNL